MGQKPIIDDNGQEWIDFSKPLILPYVMDCKFLKAGTVLVPKPEYLEWYKKNNNWVKHIVTKEEEKQECTIGERWMISQ